MAPPQGPTRTSTRSVPSSKFLSSLQVDRAIQVGHPSQDETHVSRGPRPFSFSKPVYLTHDVVLGFYGQAWCHQLIQHIHMRLGHQNGVDSLIRVIYIFIKTRTLQTLSAWSPTYPRGSPAIVIPKC